MAVNSREELEQRVAGVENFLHSRWERLDFPSKTRLLVRVGELYSAMEEQTQARIFYNLAEGIVELGTMSWGEKLKLAEMARKGLFCGFHGGIGAIPRIDEEDKDKLLKRIGDGYLMAGLYQDAARLYRMTDNPGLHAKADMVSQYRRC